MHLPELIGSDGNLQEVVPGEFITKHEIMIAQHLPGGTIPVQPLPSRNIVARLRQKVCSCAGIFAHALRSPKLAHLKQNEREPHNQEMYTVPNTVDTTRWGRAYTRFTEAVHMVPGTRRRFWASESDDPRSHFVFRKISPDFVGPRIVRIWGLHQERDRGFAEEARALSRAARG